MKNHQQISHMQDDRKNKLKKISNMTFRGRNIKDFLFLKNIQIHFSFIEEHILAMIYRWTTITKKKVERRLNYVSFHWHMHFMQY